MTQRNQYLVVLVGACILTIAVGMTAQGQLTAPGSSNDSAFVPGNSAATGNSPTQSRIAIPNAVPPLPSSNSSASADTRAIDGQDSALADTDAVTASSSTLFTKNLLDVIRDGGPLMLPIAVCSFILFVFVFERSISLRRGRAIPRPFVKRFLTQLNERELDRAEAIKRCKENRSPVAEVFLAACKKWGRPAVEVEQAVIDSGERVTNHLRKYLRLFNGIATITPLLGLLGTVLGMIRAFDAIVTAGAMGRPELLAAGISQALLTTAGGLTVAIPALIAYLFFVSRVDRLIMDIDALAHQVVEHVSAEAIKEKSSKTPASGRRKAA